MMGVKELKHLYSQRKEQIKQRLEDFREVGKKTDEELFKELCFCLLTPQSKARTSDQAIKRMRKCGVMQEGSVERVRACMTGVRFKNVKAKRIVKARKLKSSLKELPEDPHQAREWLVKNVKGLGYKEASHFLRNIGYRGLAILDRHILKNLEALGVIEEPKTLTKKRYLEIEEKMKEFSENIGIPLDELDLLLWSKETGEIFK